MEKHIKIKYLKEVSGVTIFNIISESDKSNMYRKTISVKKLDNYINKANNILETAKEKYEEDLEMLEVIKKHEEIMQERFEEKYWFWITTAEEYIENMKAELDEDEFEDLMNKLNEYEYDKDDYILDRYNGLDVSFHKTLKDAYFTGIDHDYGKHIYEEVLEELNK